MKFHLKNLKKKVNNQGFILEKPKREYKIYNLDLGNKDSKDNNSINHRKDYTSHEYKDKKKVKKIRETNI